MSGTIPLLPLYAFMAQTWKTLPFLLNCIHSRTSVTYLTSLALYDTLKHVWTVNKPYSILSYSTWSNSFYWTQLCTDSVSIMFTSSKYMGQLGIVNGNVILKWIIIVSGKFWHQNQLYHI
jgi:hypothetical protein